MDTAEKRAVAALWALRGVGPRTLERVRARAGPLGELLERPFSQWAAGIRWRPEALASLGAWRCLAEVADELARRCRVTRQAPVFPGEPGWPARLDETGEAPPLLFMRGPGAAGPPRRRLAFVGTRAPESGAKGAAVALAQHIATAGVGIVSGAASGLDQCAHNGAMDRKGETWAFLGSALDQVDAPQVEVVARLADCGGTVFSQFPPGARSNQSTFTLRNKLIAGASDAVLVFRAPKTSGALYTAAAALRYGRPLLVTPGDPWNAAAAGSNALLQQGAAACLSVADVLRAVGLEASLSEAPPEAPPEPVDLSGLSPDARSALSVLTAPMSFEALQEASALPPDGLASALIELELHGLVLQKAGRRFERR